MPCCISCGNAAVCVETQLDASSGRPPQPEPRFHACGVCLFFARLAPTRCATPAISGALYQSSFHRNNSFHSLVGFMPVLQAHASPVTQPATQPASQASPALYARRMVRCSASVVHLVFGWAIRCCCLFLNFYSFWPLLFSGGTTPVQGVCDGCNGRCRRGFEGFHNQ